MKIHYVGHACLLVDTGDLRIAVDPWLQGSAYCKQWHLFPRPVNAHLTKAADVILISHGHEDHLHEESLRQMPRGVKVFYPYTWFGGTKKFLESIGFDTVIEARPLQRYRLTSETFVSYLVNSLDSIMIIESKGKILVNVNDALHASPPRIADVFVRELKERWPRIDTLFCGFGGASYFPNTIHCPGKNDVEIGEAREQLFARNFCRIVHDLNPEVAVPFAADFALLRPQQRWINEVRFPRSRLPNYFTKLYGSRSGLPGIQPMYSGDVLCSNRLIGQSPYRDRLREGDVSVLIAEQYADEIAESESRGFLEETSAEALQQEILANLRSRAKLFDPATLNKIRFTLKVIDLRDRPYFLIKFHQAMPSIQRSRCRGQDSILELETSSEILRYSFASEWGGDAITIGYGCEIQVFDPQTLNSNLDTICVRLLTRHPTSRWKVEPLRWLRYVWESPVEPKEYSNNILNQLVRETLFRPKCEVCRACDMLFDAENTTVA